MTPPKSTSRAVLAVAALLMFWLGNRMGGIYQTTNGTVTQKLAEALNLQLLLAHPLRLSVDALQRIADCLAAGIAASYADRTADRAVPAEKELQRNCSGYGALQFYRVQYAP